MLVINRKVNGAILLLNGVIRIQVLGIEDAQGNPLYGRVRLGIEAPMEVDVHREEVVLARQAQAVKEAQS
jgi:carbon storage regulator CsrA